MTKYLGTPELKTEGRTVAVDPDYVAAADDSAREDDRTDKTPPMTVADLIAVLQKLPSDLRVFVAGYEGGLSNPVIGGIEKVDLDVDLYSGVYGRHGRHKEREDTEDDPPSATINGIVIDRP